MLDSNFVELKLCSQGETEYDHLDVSIQMLVTMRMKLVLVTGKDKKCKMRTIMCTAGVTERLVQQFLTPAVLMSWMQRSGENSPTI